MVYQQPAMHEKPPPPQAPASSLSFSLSFSMGWALVGVLCSAKQGDLSYVDRQKADFAWGHCHSPQTDFTVHWANDIRHGSVQRGYFSHNTQNEEDNGRWVKSNWTTVHYYHKENTVYSAGKEKHLPSNTAGLRWPGNHRKWSFLYI